MHDFAECGVFKDRYVTTKMGLGVRRAPWFSLSFLSAASNGDIVCVAHFLPHSFTSFQ